MQCWQIEFWDVFFFSFGICKKIVSLTGENGSDLLRAFDSMSDNFRIKIISNPECNMLEILCEEEGKKRAYSTHARKVR